MLISRRKLINTETVTTSFLLHSLSKLFKTPERYQNEIIEIGRLLTKRDDLFINFIHFFEDKQILDDTHYWYPNVKHTNMFSYICGLFDDVTSKFQFYVAWSLILGGQPSLKLPKNEAIEIMNKDMEMFKELKIKTSMPITKETQIFSRVVSHCYWTAEKCKEFSFFEFGIENCCQDRSYKVCGCFSMVEVEIEGSKKITVVVTVKALEDLVTKNEENKDYWIKMGIVDNDWNYLV